MESKRNEAFSLAGDTMIELMTLSCLDGKGRVFMEELTGNIIKWTLEMPQKRSYLKKFHGNLAGLNWKGGIEQYMRLGITVKVQAVCRLLVLQDWDKLGKIYEFIMARNGRLEPNYRTYPIETFNRVFTYIMMRLPRENRKSIPKS